VTVQVRKGQLLPLARLKPSVTQLNKICAPNLQAAAHKKYTPSDRPCLGSAASGPLPKILPRAATHRIG
jgi:hypothetical protein